MTRQIAKFFDRWVARNAFNALIRFVDMSKLTKQELDDCIVTLDILRSKM